MKRPPAWENGGKEPIAVLVRDRDERAFRARREFAVFQFDLSVLVGVADGAVFFRFEHGEMSADGAEIEIDFGGFLRVGIDHQLDLHVGFEDLVGDLKRDQDFPQGLFRVRLRQDLAVFVHRVEDERPGIQFDGVSIRFE